MIFFGGAVFWIAEAPRASARSKQRWRRARGGCSFMIRLRYIIFPAVTIVAFTGPLHGRAGEASTGFVVDSRVAKVQAAMKEIV